jgi:hypothetical protein
MIVLSSVYPLTASAALGCCLESWAQTELSAACWLMFVKLEKAVVHISRQPG